MLKLIKFIIKALIREGRSLVQKQFQRRLIDVKELQPIISKNRDTLRSIPNWISEETYTNSIFGYGIPNSIMPLLDKDIGNEPTYTDVIVYLRQRLFNELNYLEIGVSVGKNILQLANAWHQVTITAFDIEEINPVLEGRLSNKRVIDRWNSSIESLKKRDSSLAEYSLGDSRNTIRYLSGDVFDNSAWERLKGSKFNLIFSDAFHSKEAILREFSMIEGNDLLMQDEFIFLWDDLADEMNEGFTEIANRLSRRVAPRRLIKGIIKIRGWLGVNEAHHNVGVIMLTSNRH